MTNNFLFSAVLTATLSIAAQTAFAAPINYSLNFDTLPSAQGWTHTGSNIGPAVFTADGSSLAWNTMPYDVNVSNQNYSYYQKTPAAGTFDTSPWTLTWDVKVQESEPATPGYYWAGAYTSVSLDGYNLAIGLGTNNISIFKDYYAWSYSYNFALPNAITDWTRITLATDANHQFQIFLDGDLLNLQQSALLTTPSAYASHKYLGAPSFVPTWDNVLGGGGALDTASYFTIGDGSIGSNANTATSCWYLTQTGGSADTVCGAALSAVPVPAAAWLFGSGLLGLVGVARRKAA